MRRSAELRRKLGLTPMAEIRHDLQEGLKAIGDLPAYVLFIFFYRASMILFLMKGSKNKYCPSWLRCCSRTKMVRDEVMCCVLSIFLNKLFMLSGIPKQCRRHRPQLAPRILM